jgi:hypothetical protein
LPFLKAPEWLWFLLNANAKHHAAAGIDAVIRARICNPSAAALRWDPRRIRSRFEAYPRPIRGVSGMHPRAFRPLHDIDALQKGKRIAWLPPAYPVQAERLRHGSNAAAPQM